MKVSLVLEDNGHGPRVLYTSTNPEEARRFYKSYGSPGKLELIINPRPDYSRTIKPQMAVAAPVSEPELIETKPAPRRRESVL